MTNYMFYGTRIAVILLTAGLIFLLVGCQMSTSSTPVEPTATAVTSVALPPHPIPTVGATPTVSTNGVVTDTTITLRIWTIEGISPETPGEAGSFVSNSLRVFERVNPNVKIEVALKKPSGKGGMLDFLRTARDVAPTIMPDVAILNTTDLNQAFTNGLIQPLDGRLDRSLVQDLIPAARKMGTVDNKLVGVPLGLDMEHTVYNTRTFTAPLVLWSDVLSSNTKYLFPAKGVNGLVNDTTLSFYFSAGGKLLNDEGHPQIDERVLRSVLDFYRQAVSQTVIAPAVVLNASTPEELWPTYLEAKAGMAQISVRQLLTDRELLKNTSFAPLPVPQAGDAPVLITHSWALVLVTDQAERQKVALDLIQLFMSTENNADWNTINKSIPTRQTAYKQVAGNDPYWAFLSDQLKTAQAQPGFVGYDQIGRIIQQAVQQVLNGEATPDQATATAIDALTP
jgi:ABC-type glycerol-3-phosphate transport system substrate-binding protein